MLPISYPHIYCSWILTPCLPELLEFCISSADTAQVVVINYSCCGQACYIKIYVFTHTTCRTTDTSIPSIICFFRPCLPVGAKLIYLAKCRKFNTSTNSPDVDNIRLLHALSGKTGPHSTPSPPDTRSPETAPDPAPGLLAYKRYKLSAPHHSQ